MSEICVVTVLFIDGVDEGLDVVVQRSKVFVGEGVGDVAHEAEQFFGEMVRNYDPFVNEADVDISVENSYHQVGEEYVIIISWPERQEVSPRQIKEPN